MIGKRIVVVAMLAAALLLSGPRPARAEEGDVVAILISMGVPSGLVAAGGIATLVGNSVTVAHRRPSLGWQVAGFVLGGLNLAIGGAWGYGLEPGNSQGMVQISASIMASHFALGVANIGLSAYSVVLKNRLERTKPRLSLVPLAAGGPGGGAFAGLGLRITEF